MLWAWIFIFTPSIFLGGTGTGTGYPKKKNWVHQVTILAVPVDLVELIEGLQPLDVVQLVELLLHRPQRFLAICGFPFLRKNGGKNGHKHEPLGYESLNPV